MPCFRSVGSICSAIRQSVSNNVFLCPLQLETKAERVREASNRVQDELREIEQQFISNRDAVIEMLLTGVMNVELMVPEVVKQNFVVAQEDWE